MATFPSKVNYATGDILTATNMNEIGQAINLLESAQFAAGKNKIINGDFGIWQRGTSFTLASNTNTFTADRMRVNGTFTGTAATITQQTFTPGTAPVAGYEGQYFMRYTAGGTTATYFDTFQPIEDVRTFAGQTVTLSFWAKASVSVVLTSYLQQQFGSGGSSPVTVAGSTATLTTSWVRYSFTIACPSISGKTLGAGNNLLAGFSAGSHTASQTIDIWGIQLEAASTASNFQTATGTKQGELAACQRYCVMYKADVTYNRYAGGLNYSATKCNGNIFLPVEMRTAPSLTTTGTASNYAVNHGADVITACSSIPAINGAGSSNKVASIDATVASGLTAGSFGTILSNNNTSSYLLFTAEL